MSSHEQERVGLRNVERQRAARAQRSEHERVIERKSSRQRRQETRVNHLDEQLRGERDCARVHQELVRTNHTEAKDEEERVRNRPIKSRRGQTELNMKRRKTVHATVCASYRSRQIEVKRNSQQDVSATISAIKR
ncbi:hypothetical protein PHYPSEUDO_009831 [Phytophthora pseudosyringae]|uniref:Uncharacterized protein n=1 Tax=Phytophthora pseudosyringae TaxID=221518 RepID=A0A8T1VC25_9STRA|nr:hypothetical protein PHYPSEUDO_009831 [Phytophthora pseudosyringae]